MFSLSYERERAGRVKYFDRKHFILRVITLVQQLTWLLITEGGPGRHGADHDQEPVGPPRQQPPPRRLQARSGPPPALAGCQARPGAQLSPLRREQAGPHPGSAGYQGIIFNI